MVFMGNKIIKSANEIQQHHLLLSERFSLFVINFSPPPSLHHLKSFLKLASFQHLPKHCDNNSPLTYYFIFEALIKWLRKPTFALYLCIKNKGETHYLIYKLN